MWLISNGANKSGSTWIFQLLESTGAFDPLPSYYQDKRFANPSVEPGLIAEAVSTFGNGDRDYLTKQHWPRMNGYVLQYDNIKMTNIIRDIRDMVVSRFHHEVRVNSYDGDVSKFISAQGPSLINKYCEYHKYWLYNKFASSDNYFVTSYEYLKDDDYSAANELFDFVGIDIPLSSRIESVQSNRFESKKNTGEGSFFRKGKVFGFKDEIGSLEEELLLNSAKSAGLKEIKSEISRINPRLGPYLKQTDVGL